MKAQKQMILNSNLYMPHDGVNETDEAIVEEIPVEPVSNTYLEEVVSRHVGNLRAIERHYKI